MPAPIYATLVDLKTHPGIPATGSDTILQAHLDAAALWIDHYTHSAFDSRSVTDERYDGTGTPYLRIRNRPVISIGSVEIDDEAIASTEYVLNELGFIVVPVNSVFNPRVWRGQDDHEHSQGAWPCGTGNITITYTWGRATVPADVNLACRLIAASWFDFDQRRGIKQESYGPTSRTYGDPEQAPMAARALLQGYVDHEVQG